MDMHNYDTVKASKKATILALPQDQRRNAIAFDPDFLPERMKSELRVETSRSN